MNPISPSGIDQRARLLPVPKPGERVLVLPFRKGAASGYDLAVTSPEATVEDYLTALEWAAGHLPLTRTRHPQTAAGGRASCRGCSGCCAERIPLTSIDFQRLTGRRDPAGEALQRLTEIRTTGPGVDIVLKRDRLGRCLFFDPSRGLCRVYHTRPLVCRTFICCPVSRRAAQLRSAVTNAGEDELVRLVLAESPLGGVDPADFEPTAFTGRWHYREVTLRDCLGPSLWRRLYQPRREKKDQERKTPGRGQSPASLVPAKKHSAKAAPSAKASSLPSRPR